MTDPADLTAVEAARRIRTGGLSSRELVAACLARIEATQPTVNAWVTVDAERALAAAGAADEAVAAGRPAGVLHGVPVGIKDIQPTAGLRTTYGSPDFADHVPADDAPIVGRIRNQGGIVLGKTNVPEHSIGANTVNPLVGATTNPWDPELTAGGSSGGSAAAVAAGTVPLATGSDHGGSLRIPASYCGVVAHRATPGTVPHELRAVDRTNYSLQGPIARTVADTALLLSVIAGRTPSDRGVGDPMAFPLDGAALADPPPIDPATLRVGVSADLGGLLVSGEVRRAFTERVGLLAGLVGEVVEPAVDLRDGPSVDWRVRQDLFVAQFAEQADRWTEATNPNVRATYDAALAAPLADYAHARRRQMELTQAFARHFEGDDAIDVLVCPGVSVPPFDWRRPYPDEVDGQPVENYLAWLGLTASLTVVGHPVVALPAGVVPGPNGRDVPFGLQLVGRLYDDRRLLGIAAALESPLHAHLGEI